MKKKTKIVSTLGPASSSKQKIRELIHAGVNVFRINFSHANYENTKEVIKFIREINEQENFSTAILADLQGPKLRIGKVEDNVFLSKGDLLRFSNEEKIGNKESVFMTYKGFARDSKVGNKVLIDDGKIILKVISIEDNIVTAEVIQGGELMSNKGVNLPNTKISLSALTEKDKKDAKFAIEQEVDWIALSFVRNATDVLELKAFIKEHSGEYQIPVLSKIEKPEALEQINQIIKESDAIMVARGDLGIEIEMENVPLLQKSIVEKCKKAKKPVIIATQMLESMLESLTPSRAEVNDIANSVLDGADAVMLSGETAVGKYPVETVEKMAQIIMKVEEDTRIKVEKIKPEKGSERFITDMICYNAAKMVRDANVKAIIALTVSGYTAFQLSASRPHAHILIFTSNQRIVNKLNLLWGVKAFHYLADNSTDDTVLDVNSIALKEGYVEKGDFLLNLNAMPLFLNSTTNTLRLTTA